MANSPKRPGEILIVSSACPVRKRHLPSGFDMENHARRMFVTASGGRSDVSQRPAASTKSLVLQFRRASPFAAMHAGARHASIRLDPIAPRFYFRQLGIR